jgi:hypothetical protein
MRTAFDRGLGNSSIAASAGEDSLLRAALQVATPDAATYGRASDYNTAAENQATMFNAEQSNQFALADKQQTQQMTIAQMQDTTQRWQAEKQDATSRYNTDAQYKQQVDNQKLGVANNIIANMELSPDRKAAMLEELGFGTMARDGTPGTGLAGAVYVIDSTSYDMTGDTFHDMAQIAAKNVNGGKPTDAEKEAWATGHTTAGTNYPTGPVMPPAPADYQPPG